MGYRIEYWADSQTKEEPVVEYLDSLPENVQAKIFAFLEYLRENDGRIDEQYAHHIVGSIYALRMRHGRSWHRIFYSVEHGRIILLLHAIDKRERKIPKRDITTAENRLIDYRHQNP